MKKQLPILMIILSTLATTIFSHPAKASFEGNLSIEIDGLKNQKGQVCINIFSNSKGFPDNSQRAVRVKCVKPLNTPLIVNFSNLKAGNYAIAVIHDANGDNTLNYNVLGIPTEGFGFSNNPIIRTGPPKFSDSAVLVAGSNTNIQIQLQYFLGR